MAKLPAFILVMAIAPLGRFRRAGIGFDRTWRAVQIGNAADLTAPIPVIDAAGYEQIRRDSEPRQLWPREPVAPPMLAVRPASEEEVEDYRRAAMESSGADVGAQLEAARARNADLEARMMRLELGAGSAKPDPALTQENADLKARLAKLEDFVAQQMAAASAQAATADKSPSKPAK